MQGTKSCDSNRALDCHLLLTFSCDSLHASFVKHSMFVLLPRFAATSFRPKVKSKVWPEIHQSPWFWWFRPGPRMKHAQCEISGRDSALCLCKEWSLVEEVDRKKVFPSKFLCFSGSWNVVRPRAKATKLILISKISVCDIGNTTQPPPKACIITAPEDQRRPRGLQWGTLWFVPASICKPAIVEFEKAKWEAFQSQDFVRSGLEDQDACLKLGVSKSPFCCSFPPCIPKIPKLSMLASHGKEECSASFQLCVGLCFRQLLSQRGRSPSLIFSLEIAACAGCKEGFVIAAGEMPSRPAPSKTGIAVALKRCKRC